MHLSILGMSILNSREPSSSSVDYATKVPPNAELVAEARRGVGFARTLVEHVIRMQAEGYSNEIQVDSQSWKITIERSSLPS